MTPSGAKASHRLKAEGFPVAPLIEAIIDVSFATPFEEDGLQRAKGALEAHYATFSAHPHHQLHFDVEKGTVEVSSAQMNFRGAGKDASEIVLLRRDGLGTSQLAPYRDWDSLYARFSRDLATVTSVAGSAPLSRMAVRSINRIDVPPEGGIVRYEDYITVHPQLPGKLDPVQDFSLELLVVVPELTATAKIIVGSYPPAVEGRASFLVDIDLFRTEQVPTDPSELADVFGRFRHVKNELYRTCLTRRALEEFEK